MAAVTSLTVRRALAGLLSSVLVVGWSSPAVAADQTSNGQWYVDFLRLSAAHQITRGDGVVVAVVDTGVSQHPDLDDQVVPGADIIGGGSEGRRDVDGHGTSMSGLIAAHGRVQGVAPEATILPVRVSDGSTLVGDDLANGINWAVDHNAKVISISLGQDDTDVLQRSVDRALAAGVVIVAAAGNTSTIGAVPYPGAYPGVVTVGGVDRAGKHSAISVDGPSLVLSAPSDGISSLRPGGRYGVGTGTSDATALVAGAVALVRAKYPELSAAEVVHRLTATADDKGAPGRDIEYGYGVVNIVKALTADVPPLTTAPTPAAEGGDHDGDGIPVGLFVGVGAGVLAVVVVLIFVWRRRRP